MKRLILASLVLAMISATAFAATSEGYGMGGWMSRFRAVIDEANRSGELFRIKGHCPCRITVSFATCALPVILEAFLADVG
jgi:hypothetical protein